MNVDRELAAARERIYADIDARVARIAADSAAAFHAAIASIEKIVHFHRRSIGQRLRRWRERTAR